MNKTKRIYLIAVLFVSTLLVSAVHAEKIQEQIYKLEYKAEQGLTESEIIEVLVYGRFRGIKGHFTPIKGKNPDRGFFPERFRVTNGRLLVCDPVPFSLEPCYGSKDFGACMETLLQCLPVTFDGKKLEYQCTHYRCPGCLEISSAPYKRSYKRDIVSTSPLRIRTIQVDTKEYGDKDDTAKYEYLEEWVND